MVNYILNIGIADVPSSLMSLLISMFLLMELREYFLERIRGGNISPLFPGLLTKLEVRSGFLNQRLQSVKIMNLGRVRAGSPHCVRQPGCDVDISLRDRITYCIR